MIEKRLSCLVVIGGKIVVNIRFLMKENKELSAKIGGTILVFFGVIMFLFGELIYYIRRGNVQKGIG